MKKLTNKSAYNLFVLSLKNIKMDKRLRDYCYERNCAECIFNVKNRVSCFVWDSQFINWKNRVNEIKDRIKVLER